MAMNILSESPSETKSIGERLGSNLRRGDVVALIGELGAGKTCFIQGLMKGMKVSACRITSPTFIIMNVYKGRVPVYHFDMYRLNNIKEVEELGYEEYFYGNGVAVVEWADKIKKILPSKCIKIYIKIIGDKKREIKFENIRYRNCYKDRQSCDY